MKITYIILYNLQIPQTIPIYYTNAKQGPNILCLHGAGHSGLSFSELAHIASKYRVISYDFRGHGYNTSTPGTELSLKNMISDTEKVLVKISQLFPKDTIIILGHSFGGAIAIKTTCNILSTETYPDLYEKIQGLIVLDVVEGSAMEALPFMMSIVQNRKNNFTTINEAIEYMHSTQIRNLHSVRVSIPPLLKEEKDEKGNKVFKWKTDLVSSEQYWKEWYENMSNCFLSVKVPKMLLITDASTLDTPLTIAHMQGKFKLNVIKGTGHFVMEDDPKEVNIQIEEFLNAFRIVKTVDEIKHIIGKNGEKMKICKYAKFSG